MKLGRTSSLIFILSLLIFQLAAVAGASFLEDTAGISASAELAPVDLTVAETAFKNIETRGADYIVGSVSLDVYDESHDVHVYLTSNGNIIAYYLNDEPASKIVDWVGYRGGEMTLEGSKLEDALTKVCQTVGQSLTPVTYFDFRHPTASSIKIIADEALITINETFKYLIPSSHTLSEASWSFAVLSTTNSYNDTSLYFDGVRIKYNSSHGTGWNIDDGQLTGGYTTPDLLHEVLISNGHVTYYDAYAAVVFVYSE